MMPMKYILPLVIFASPAWAICKVGEETFMSCQIEDSGKELSVCFTDDVATYRFGSAGKTSELTIITSVADLDYTPWNGVGRSIYEGVRFTNAGYDYEVFGGFDKLSADEAESDIVPAHFGGVYVSKNDQMVVDLVCDTETVDYAWGEGLYDAKMQAGFVWDSAAFAWIPKSE